MSGRCELELAKKLSYRTLTLIACGLGASGCKSEGGVAVLLDHQGQVARTGAGDTWHPAKGGDRFACDDGLRTVENAWARVDIRQSGRVRLDQSTLIRFRCTGTRAGFDIEAGEASVVTTDDGVDFDFEIGPATLAPRGEYRFRAKDGQMQLEVVAGSAIIERAGKGAEEVGPGSSLELTIGRAEVERAAPDAAPVPIDAGVDAGTGAGTVATGVTVVAVLRGRKNRARPPDGQGYERIGAGEHTLAPGTSVRLGRRGSAHIARGPERIQVTGPAEITIGSPDAELASAKGGQATILATTSDVTVLVPGGEITARGGRGAESRARLEVDRRRTRVRALRGQAAITGKTGSREILEIGERVVLSHKGLIEVYGRAPARADVVVAADESPVIHDPRPPTAVSVRFAGLCHKSGGDAIVEVSRRKNFRGEIAISKNQVRANVLLGRGGHYYRVRCLEEGAPQRQPVARGRIRILRDRATRRLARGVPKNLVEADGRLWVVHYQNRLPQITFKWLSAADGPYRLHVQSTRGSESVVKIAKPTYRMRSGALTEGTYQYYFAGKSQRSRLSTLRIEFDNAAPSAYLRLPRPGQTWRGNSLKVAGAALPGSTVNVAGAEVDTDRQGRFTARVSLPVPAGALSVRTSHPKVGVHYYLRRNGGKVRRNGGKVRRNGGKR